MAVEILDETAADPVRSRIGRLLRAATAADFAVSRVRLAALDLTREEVAGVAPCRVLLGRLDAAMLHDAREAVRADRLDRLHVLREFAASGRLEVRSAGLAGWAPDFSVVRSSPAVVLLGAHYFGTPYPVLGPSFTVVTEDPAVVAHAAATFEALWRGAHDVLPAIRDVLERAHELSIEPPRGGRGGDDPGAVR